MKTIESRAEEYADNFVVGDSAIIVDLLHKVAEESYIKGATEQREIDTDKACKWLLENCFVDMGSHDTDVHFKSGYIHDFLKAMREE